MRGALRVVNLVRSMFGLSLLVPPPVLESDQRAELYAPPKRCRDRTPGAPGKPGDKLARKFAEGWQARGGY